MIGRISRFIAGLLDRNQHSEDSHFVGSRLDWSVNYGHDTSGSAEATREIAQIQAQAQLLDDRDQYRQ